MNSISFNQDAFSRLDVPLPENIFANAFIPVKETVLKQIQAIIDAIESVIALPCYQNYVLATAPQIAGFEPKAQSVFFGYDFHIDENGQPKLIEINTNAGGALLNSLQFKTECEAQFFQNFQEEWQLSQRSSEPLRTIAIVDDAPQTQYLYAEFLLFKELFKTNGIETIICAPENLEYHSQRLWYGNIPIDLVYNRLTDFVLTGESQKALANAYLAGDVVVTPHPRAHTLYANKRNLTILSNGKILTPFGVSNETRELLENGIAFTTLVETKTATNLWSMRKRLFFKPAQGYGSNGAYRGDKLTKRVFEEF